MYETADGRVPVAEWLDAMHAKDVSTHDRIINRIDRIEAGSTSNFRPEGEGVTALKMDFGPGYRLYFGQDGKDLVILLIGGDKSSQDEDIATAKSYWRDYNA
jgi:putative addiction module killer protein